MAFRISLSTRTLVSLVLALLTGCAQAPNYAPVKTVNQTLEPEIDTEGKISPSYPVQIPKQAGNVQKTVPSAQKNAQIAQQPRAKVNSASRTKPAMVDRNRTDSTHSQEKPPSRGAPYTSSLNPIQRSKALDKKPQPPQNNQKIKQSAEKNIVDLKQKIPMPQSIDSAKPLKNNETISKATNIASQKKVEGKGKSPDKTQVGEKKLKTQKSIISIDNKKVLKLNFEWPLQGKISRNFAQTDHKGIDIIGKNGQTVRAAESGKAVYCGQGLKGFGNLAIIKHNDTYLSAYANNSKLYIKEGQEIKKGEPIGQMGVTGIKKSSLHFEIRKNGIPINPLSLLPNH